MTPALWHFANLTHEQQRECVRELAAQGLGDHEISRLTGLHVRIVREAIAEQARSPGSDHDELRGTP